MSEHLPGTEGESRTVEPPSAGEFADDSRSGGGIAEAIGTAEAGTALHETHTHPERTKSGEAHVEQVAGDPAMTRGQHVRGAGAPEPSGPSPAEAGSGGAQSLVGARVSDRLAAGEPQPAGGPFETETADTASDASGGEAGSGS